MAFHNLNSRPFRPLRTAILRLFFSLTIYVKVTKCQSVSNNHKENLTKKIKANKRQITVSKRAIPLLSVKKGKKFQNLISCTFYFIKKPPWFGAFFYIQIFKNMHLAITTEAKTRAGLRVDFLSAR